MSGTKVAATFIFITILISLQISKIYVPHDFEQPILYRSQATIIYIIGFLNRIYSLFNNLHPLKNFAATFTYLTVGKKNYDEKVVIEERVFNNVSVRIYYPHSIHGKDRPIMVYYHGGAFMVGHPDMHDLYLFDIVKELHMVAVSVELAPDYPLPIPTEDCYAATRYILDNPDQLGVNLDKLILAGDSAGGNAVAVLTQRFKKENLKLPKIQVLIYPWTQLLHMLTPSSIFYDSKEVLQGAPGTFAHAIALIMGIHNASEEIEDAINNNEHLLIFSKEEQESIEKHLNIDNIPQRFKAGRPYYDDFRLKKSSLLPQRALNDSIFSRDSYLKNIFEKLIQPEISPLFANDQDLVGLPKAYFLILEWDSLKDQCILYAERLKKQGVEVEINFSEQGFHGVAPLVDAYRSARDMQKDLIKFLKSNI